MKVAIIKYNSGNVQSVQFALQRLGIEAILTEDAEVLQQADRVIFPGVGEANATMRYLKARELDQVIINLKQPVLGICLGMQLLCSYSEENDTACLGVFDVAVKRFPAIDLKVPHMGWNQLQFKNGWLPPETVNKDVYFVHSYYVPENQYTTAVTNYGVKFSAAIQKNNFYGVQFHPEKSAKAGEIILKKFIEL